MVRVQTKYATERKKVKATKMKNVKTICALLLTSIINIYKRASITPKTFHRPPDIAGRVDDDEVNDII